MKAKLMVAAALAAAGMACGPSALAASGLPDPTYFGDVTLSNDYGPDSPHHLSSTGSINFTSNVPAYPDFGLPDASFAEGTTTISGTPSPLIKESTLTIGTASAGGVGTIAYDFEVLGSPGKTAEVRVGATATANIPWIHEFVNTDYVLVASGDAEFQFEFGTADVASPTGVNPNPAYAYATNLSDSIGVSVKTAFTYQLDQTFELSTNTVYAVYIELGLDVGNESGQQGIALPVPAGANGTADPTFTLAGPNANQYSLVFSSGIGDTPIASTVPEPSTWIMLLVGFAGLGYGSSRRRLTFLLSGRALAG